MTMENHAVVLNASTDDVGPTTDDLDDAGHDVSAYPDGVATNRPVLLVGPPEHPINEVVGGAEACGMVAGPCGFWADSSGSTE